MIEWEKIDFKGKTSGEVNCICPECSHNRKPANQKLTCLRVNLDKGVGKCHHCGLIALKSLKKDVKTYNTPKQDWQNFTKLSKRMVLWFSERGISQKTLINNKITEEKYFQPAHGHECNNIVFNYFEGEKLVNKKFRSPKKKFTQIKDAKKVFYGINDVIGETECYIVEGEMDKLAMYEAGIKNCISVPNGANDLNNIFETCGDYLESMEKIYIAVDNDEPGKKLEHELIKRFGKWRCAKIEFKHGKDANDELMAGKLELIAAIENPKKYPVDGAYSPNDVLDEMLYSLENGLEEVLKPKNERFNEWNNIFSVVPGQLTTVTGVPSHGKSHFLEDYLLNMINDNDLCCTFYSPEHLPVYKHAQQLCTKVMGKPYHYSYNFGNDSVPQITKDEIKEFANWSKDKIFMVAPDKGETVDWPFVMDKFKEQMFATGSDIFVIDAFNKVRMQKPGDLGEINQILADLTSLAQAYEVSIFLVAHPKKMGKDEAGLVKMPDLYDVKGSGDFYDQTHNGFSVYRYFNDNSPDGRGYVEVTNLKTKFQHQGSINESCEFYYDIPTMRYYPKGSEPNRDCLFKPKEKKTMTEHANPDAWIEPLEKIDW